MPNALDDILKTKLCAGPLAGISAAPFRVLPFLLNENWARPDFSCTEMLSAKHVANGNRQNPRFIVKDKREGKLCVQLAANNANDAAIAAEYAINTIGADMLDLNLGCPKPKIRKKGIGSALLGDYNKVAQIIKAMQIDKSIPVLAKIRVDGASCDNNNLDIAKAIADAGAAALTVHGRNWRDDYATEIHYDQIAIINAAIPIPVIANGDVFDASSADTMFKKTDCAAVMISRGMLGKPWVFAEIDAHANDANFERPQLSEVSTLIEAHIQGLIDLIGEHCAILQARRLVRHYIRPFADENNLLQLQTINTYNDLEKILGLLGDKRI